MRRTSWVGISLSLALSVTTAFGQAQDKPTPQGPPAPPDSSASPAAATPTTPVPSTPPGHVILTPEPDSNEIVEIHLGTAAAPSSVDRSAVEAVESFLAARQDGSIDRSVAERVRARMQTPENVPTATLFGPKGGVLAAFDFGDGAITRTEHGFQVPVTLLFTDSERRIVETRDESLTFTHEGGGYVCTDLHTTNVVSWKDEGVHEAAKRAGAEWELERVERHLREWSSDRDDMAGYSVTSVKPRGDGSFLVNCVRYEASPGRRGYRVDTSPIVLRRSGDSIRIDTN